MEFNLWSKNSWMRETMRLEVTELIVRVGITVFWTGASFVCSSNLTWCDRAGEIVDLTKDVVAFGAIGLDTPLLVVFDVVSISFVPLNESGADSVRGDLKAVEISFERKLSDGD